MLADSLGFSCDELFPFTPWEILPLTGGDIGESFAGVSALSTTARSAPPVGRFTVLSLPGTLSFLPISAQTNARCSSRQQAGDSGPNK
jgi:hypothetical protein